MNVRSIVKQHLEEQALRNYLKSKYDQTSSRDKKKFLKEVDDSIEAQLDLILRSFVEDIQKGSPDKKRRRYISIFNLVMTAILTPAIGYAVNIEHWTFVWILSVVLAGVQIYNVIGE
jgi:hypothetical protein